MKKFFIKGSIFIIIGYIFLFSLFNYVLTGHADEKYLIKKILKNRTKIKAIAIGTSHIWAVNFKSLGINGIELGLGGRDLAECKYVLDFLLDQKNNNIKKVFISISYFSLYQDNNPVDGSMTDNRIVMYNNIPSWKMIKGDMKNYLSGKFLPFIQSDHWRNIVIELYEKNWKLKLAFVNIAAEAFAEMPGTLYEQKTIPLKEVKARVNKQHLVHERAKKNNMYNTKEYNLFVIKQIILMFKKKGVDPIFITPPYYFEYTKLYNKKYINEMKTEMNKFVRKYDVTYLDFSMDPDFIYQGKYFKDADHINYKASWLLGEKIKKLLHER